MHHASRLDSARREGRAWVGAGAEGRAAGDDNVENIMAKAARRRDRVGMDENGENEHEQILTPES
jgi:hypothetical protein